MANERLKLPLRFFKKNKNPIEQILPNPNHPISNKKRPKY
jgi:hypothetical protein